VRRRHLHNVISTGELWFAQYSSVPMSWNNVVTVVDEMRTSIFSGLDDWCMENGDRQRDPGSCWPPWCLAVVGWMVRAGVVGFQTTGGGRVVV
jgi:hypothetical protein